VSEPAYTELDLCQPGFRLRIVVTLGEAIDFYIAELARRGRSLATRRSYRRLLGDFTDVVRDMPPGELKLEDYERFLDRWTDAKPSTLASGISLVRGFSAFLHERGFASANVAAVRKRPRRPRPEDVEVITVSAEDVQKMLAACRDLRELLCLTSAIYPGARLAALARVRRRRRGPSSGNGALAREGRQDSRQATARRVPGNPRRRRAGRPLALPGRLPDPEPAAGLGQGA
jgi:hypothetical protein